MHIKYMFNYLNTHFIMIIIIIILGSSNPMSCIYVCIVPNSIPCIQYVNLLNKSLHIDCSLYIMIS